MIATLWIDARFSAGHFLPHVAAGSRCRRPHGHNYRVRIRITGPMKHDGLQTGMVVDFDEIKPKLAAVLEQLDHHDLNTILPNPTAEHVAEWILCRLPECVDTIELREMEDCGVVLHRSDLCR